MNLKRFITTLLVTFVLLAALLPLTATSVHAASIDLQVGASADDCAVYWDGSAWKISTSSAYIHGGTSSGVYAKEGGGMRFTNVTIPQASTITSAYLSIKCRVADSDTTVNTYITGEKVADASTFSTIADYQARRGTVVGGANDDNITTAQVAWDDIGAWTLGTWYDSPDITSIIQEIVNQGTWASGNDLVIFWDDHDYRGSHVSGVLRDGCSYNSAAANAPKLHIEWSEIVAPTVTTQAASAVSFTTATLNGNITDTGGENCTTRGFEYDTDSGAPYANDTHTDGSYGSGAYTADITSLARGDTFYYRAYATNSAGTSYGAEQSFTTLTGEPSVSTDAATYVSPGIADADLNGELTDMGDDTDVDVSFEWDYTSGAPYSFSTTPENLVAPGLFHYDLSGFLRNQIVYYRAKAVNDYGTVYGSEEAFLIEVQDPTLVGWFEPNTMILGTTLPDRATTDGVQNGIIHWGANGDVDTDGGVPPGPVTTPVIEPNDYLPETEGGTDKITIPDGTALALTSSPFYPLVDFLADLTDFSEIQIWQFLLDFIILLVVIGSLIIFGGHQFISGLAGLALIWFGVSLDIYPWFALLIGAVYFIATLIMERTPSI